MPKLPTQIEKTTLKVKLGTEREKQT